MLISLSGKIGSGKDTFAALLIKAIVSIKFKDAIGFPNVTISNANGTLNIQIVKFADALKDIVCRLTGCTRNQLEDQNFKNSFMPREWDYTVPRPGKREDGLFGKDEVDIKQRTYRQFLQELGTNVLRNWIPNIHVNATFSAWKLFPVYIEGKHWAGHAITMGSQVESQYPKWIITDMRFPNELVAVKERNGITIRINRRVDLRDPQALVASMIGTGSQGISPQPLGGNMYEAAMRIHKPHESETALDNAVFDEVIDNDGTMEDLYNKALEIVNKYKLHEQ